jgi:hypothetical protein
VFENRVLRKIYEPERDEITRRCKNTYNEEIHNVNFSVNIMIIKIRNEWA